MASRSMTKGLLAGAAALAALALAAPAGAGVRYTAVSEGDGAGGTVRVEVEGEAVRVEFLDRGQAMFGKGDYLVSADGGDTLYWVEPKKSRYSEVDFERVARFFGRLMEGVPGLFTVRVEEPQIYRLFEERVPDRFGLPTWHVRYLMTYRQRSRSTLPARGGVQSTKSETWNQVVQDVWFTDAVAAPAPDFWFREQFRSGYPDFDRRMAAETRLIEGFPLRVETVEVSSTRDLERTRVILSGDTTEVTRKLYLGDGVPRGELEYDRRTTEVTAFEITAEPIAPERFRPPEGFAKKN